jgi:hypothetical protein
MGVDQPRHQCASAKIDARRVGAGGADRAIGNLLDSIVFDQDLDPFLDVGLARIEKFSAVEKVGCHCRSPLRLRA